MRSPAIIIRGAQKRLENPLKEVEMKWEMGVSVEMRGIRERGIACHLIHLRRHFKATKIPGFLQERCNETPLLTVVAAENIV